MLVPSAASLASAMPIPRKPSFDKPLHSLQVFSDRWKLSVEAVVRVQGFGLAGGVVNNCTVARTSKYMCTRTRRGSTPAVRPELKQESFKHSVT